MRVWATPTGGPLSFYATVEGDQVSREQAAEMIAIMNQKKVVLETNPHGRKFLDVKV